MKKVRKRSIFSEMKTTHRNQTNDLIIFILLSQTQRSEAILNTSIINTQEHAKCEGKSHQEFDNTAANMRTLFLASVLAPLSTSRRAQSS
jgi:hypothetical protein